MTTDKINHIGTLLAFDEAGFHHVQLRFENHIFPAVRNLKAQYEAMPFENTTFTDAVFKSLLADRAASERAKYEAVVKKDVEKFKSPYLRRVALNGLDEDFVGLYAAIDKLYELRHNNSGFNTLTVNLEDISIDENGEPVIDLESIRSQYETRIETEEESDLYEMALEVQRAHGKLRDYVLAQGVTAHNFSIITNGQFGGNHMLREDSTCELHINIDMIKSLPTYAEKLAKYGPPRI